MNIPNKLAVFLISLITLIFIPSLSNADSLEKKKMHDRLEVAKAAGYAQIEFIKGNHAQAMQMINQVIAKYGQFPDGYMTRGDFHFKLDELDLALADFNRAIDLDPDPVSAYEQKAFVLERQCNDTEARMALHHFIEKATPYGNLYSGSVTAAKNDLTRQRLYYEINCKTVH